MRQLLKISTLLIALTMTACETSRPQISLGLGPITCPASAMQNIDHPPTLDRPMLDQMTPEASAYVTSREAWWDTVLANAEQIQIDTLNLCRDVNNAEASRTHQR